MKRLITRCRFLHFNIDTLQTGPDLYKPDGCDENPTGDEIPSKVLLCGRDGQAHQYTHQSNAPLQNWLSLPATNCEQRHQCRNAHV